MVPSKYRGRLPKKCLSRAERNKTTVEQHWAPHEWCNLQQPRNVHYGSIASPHSCPHSVAQMPLRSSYSMPLVPLCPWCTLLLYVILLVMVPTVLPLLRLFVPRMCKPLIGNTWYTTWFTAYACPGAMPSLHRPCFFSAGRSASINASGSFQQNSSPSKSPGMGRLRPSWQSQSEEYHTAAERPVVQGPCSFALAGQRAALRWQAGRAPPGRLGPGPSLSPLYKLRQCTQLLRSLRPL